MFQGNFWIETEVTIMATPTNSIGIVMHANHGIPITMATIEDNPVANAEMVYEINVGTC